MLIPATKVKNFCGNFYSLNSRFRLNSFPHSVKDLKFSVNDVERLFLSLIIASTASNSVCFIDPTFGMVRAQFIKTLVVYFCRCLPILDPRILVT